MELKTEHPHVVKVDGVCGGRAVVKGTRITVQLIADLFRQECTAQEILSTYPPLSPAAVYDAISYYFDHQAEIETEGDLEVLKHKYGFEVGEKGLIQFK